LSQSPTREEYGLLAKIIGKDQYYHLTNLTWTQEVEPTTYDPAINDYTVTHTRKRMEQEWERKRKTWAIRKGFLRGVAANFRKALDKNWYSQLKSVHTAYRNTNPIQILDHLNSRWCLLDVHAKRIYAWPTTWIGTENSISQPSESTSSMAKCISKGTASQYPTRINYNLSQTDVCIKSL
jgi:hypothetical protein